MCGLRVLTALNSSGSSSHLHVCRCALLVAVKHGHEATSSHHIDTHDLAFKTLLARTEESAFLKILLKILINGHSGEGLGMGAEVSELRPHQLILVAVKNHALRF
jgi:hypothetical protein